MPKETSLTAINLFKSQADYEANKHNLAEEDLVAVAIDLIPVGTIIAYAGNETPSGFLDCSGASLNPTTYDNLFKVIGTTYGGDGSTTFNLPNLNNNSFLEGSGTVGTVKSASSSLADHIHAVGYNSGNNSGTWISTAKTATYISGVTLDSQASYSRRWNGSGSDNTLTSIGTAEGAYNANIGTSLPISSSQSSATVQPKSVTVKFCIKY